MQLSSKSMKILICIICGLMLVTQGVGAKKNYTLNELVQLMKSNNLLFKISDIDKDIAREEYRINRVLPNPEFEYSRGQGDLRGEDQQPSLWAMGLKLSVPNPLHRYFLLQNPLIV